MSDVLIPKAQYAELFEKLYAICKENGWGDPFSYARSREILIANLLGHKIGTTYSGADAYDEDGKCEYKSTITKNIQGAYTGISRQDTWEQQETYLRQKKIGPYHNHYFIRFLGCMPVEVYKMTADKVLEFLIPKIKARYHSLKKRKDARPNATIPRKYIIENATEINLKMIKEKTPMYINPMQAELPSKDTSIPQTENTILSDNFEPKCIDIETAQNTIEIKCSDGLEYLKTLDNNSIDLILTDPPYLISKDSGMNKFKKTVNKIEKSGKDAKTEEEWVVFKQKKEYKTDKYKANYIKYGNTSGKKYGFHTEYGTWDKEFTIEKLDEFVKLFYKKLRKGGTCIIFFDLWKITPLKEMMEKYKFKQIRLIEWIKTNPVPLNQSVNYLTNAREVAVLGVKGGKPTFNSKYDVGIYKFPIENGKHRFHKTQKSLKLFEALVQKHSSENDVVLDTFLGGGTTAFACKNLNRKFKGCEISKEYCDKIIELSS